jgi:DNA-directed RNA polymerase subunit RPC12/RpoP/transposase-like protein
MKVRKCTITEHRKKFGTEMQCLQHLADIKWKSGYKCRKCEHTIFIKGRVHLDRKCQKCGHNESPKSGTLFHSMKLPLVLVFEIIYRVAVNKKGLGAISISREFGVNQKTATLLRNKIQAAMCSTASFPLTGEVHVDEFLVGGPEVEMQGRSGDSKKKKAIIAVEVLPKKKGIGRIYAMHIDDFSTVELRKIFDKHLDAQTFVVSDQWTGYKPLKNEYPNLIQLKSENGKNFPELHLMIMNLKAWLKGIHHKISSTHFQKYLDEFTYRFNRRAFIETINTNLINRMITNPKIKHKPKKLRVLQNAA